MSEDLFAPEGGWRVRILDQSGALEDDIVEEIKGFPSLMQANAFCRAYVRDSVEICRVPGASAREALANWFAYGEDAEVVDAGEEGWRSAGELEEFAARSASEEERDWRILDPRREDLEPDEGDETAFDEEAEDEDDGDGDDEDGNAT